MKFYKLSIDEGRRKKYAWAFPLFGTPDKLVNCHVCGRKWYDSTNVYEEHLSFPICFTNNHFADFITCEAKTLVNDTVKNFLVANDICTPKFAKMPVVSKSELTKEQMKQLRYDGYNVYKFHDEKPVYYRLGAEVGARLHPDSNVEWVDFGEYVCKHCGYGVGYKRRDYFAPYYIELGSWDGSDLFRVEEFMGGLYCTEKLKNLCQEQMFTGICFDEVEAK